MAEGKTPAGITRSGPYQFQHHLPVCSLRCKCRPDTGEEPRGQIKKQDVRVCCVPVKQKAPNLVCGASEGASRTGGTPHSVPMIASRCLCRPICPPASFSSHSASNTPAVTPTCRRQAHLRAQPVSCFQKYRPDSGNKQADTTNTQIQMTVCDCWSH